MAGIIKLKAENRDVSGTGVARALRRDGFIPAVVYSNGDAATSFSISFKDFFKEYKEGGIKTRLVELDFGSKVVTALVKSVQTHVVTDAPIHIDFIKADKNTNVKVNIAIHVINEDKCPGIKKGGLVNIVSRSVAFYCKPINIPNHIEIDIADLEIGRNVHISDITLPEGVSPVDPSNFTLVSIMGRASDSEAGAEAAATA